MADKLRFRSGQVQLRRLRVDSQTVIEAGDLVYLEDRTGKGHITRLLTPVANIFIRMEDDFDLLAWAAAAPPSGDIWN